jgi:glyoxylase-like metal-dependent hydrolase (beta-lactamase superfamily II)
MASVLLGSYRWHTASVVPPPAIPRALLLRPVAGTLVPGIHLLGGLSPAAAYVVETSEGLVLIDTGLEPDAGPLKREMELLGLDWRRLRAILLTHVHGDHTGGAEWLRSATGAKVYAGRADALVLKAGGPREAFVSTFYMPEAAPRPTTVDVELTGDQVIAVGDARFHALAAPGHTHGSVCYLLERNNLRALFAGDVILSLRGDELSPVKWARPLGTYAAYLAPRYRGDAQAFLATLRKLQALPVPDLVLPGHPRLDRLPQSPVLSQQRWEALLDEGIRDMEKLLARRKADGALFLDGSAKKLLPDLYYLGDFQGLAVYAFFRSSKLFLVDAPGGPGLAEFVPARLQALGVKPAPPAAVLLTSCGPEATGGLPELVQKYQARVVAPSAGLRRVKEACPGGTVVVPVEELPREAWFEVQSLPLGGRGLAPVAYQLSWAGKRVLFSGRIPIRRNQAAVEALLADFRKPGGALRTYQASLDKLDRLKPDLWLPAVPMDGQNANLYDTEWQDLLTANRELLP